MPTDTFQLAVQRARRNFGEAEWLGLTFSDQARLIYRELRQIDEDAVAAMLRPRQSDGGTASEGADLT